MITKILKFFACSIFIFIICTKSVSAQTDSFLITNGFSVPFPDFTNGRVFFYTNLGINFKSGKVVLSSTPDGTGNISIGDSLDITMQYPHQGYQRIYGYSNNCLSFQNSLPPQDVTNLFNANLNNGLNVMLVRLQHWCFRAKTISPLYFVHTYQTATPTPTPTATPTPTPKPFLDLPWDYKSKGMTFNEAALSMSSYFDHEYPLLSGGLAEPNEGLNTLISYRDSQRVNNLSYSGHDGYDYAYRANVKLGDSVLAAADGTAKYVNTCSACGNMIVIDHGNGYQTRYMHMQYDGLISTDSAKIVYVKAGEQIGKVGYSGRVFPAGEAGSHIHFGVFQDVNKDGNFEDNIPDGASDPFGWNSKDPDPWEHYTFDYFGVQKKGNKSYYLWKDILQNKEENVSSAGNKITIHNASLDFPTNFTSEPINVHASLTPVFDSNPDLTSIGVGYLVEAFDSFGNGIHTFLNSFNVSINFSTYDVSKIDIDSLSIYSSPDGETWTKEPTVIDMTTKTATTTVNHLTQFALMGKRLDTTAPVTSVLFEGDEGKKNNFRSDVTVSLAPTDNEGGLGVDYSAITIKGPDIEKEWDVYKGPLFFSSEGSYTVQYYSVDKDGNTEEVKTAEFSIDKTPPEAEIVYDLQTQDAIIIGHDGINGAAVSEISLGKNKEKVVIADDAGNTLTILDKDHEKGKKAVLNIYSLQYNESDPFNLDENKISFTSSNDKDDTLKSLTQVYQVQGVEKVKLDYNAKTNKTKVIWKVKGLDKEKEQIDGIKILKLITNNGVINYQY